MPRKASALGTTLILAFLTLSAAASERGFAPNDVIALGERVAALSPSVRRDEARSVALSAYARAEELRQNYRVIGPPLFHNFLVNTGIRKRGLCFQWAEDLLAALDRLKLSTLELHWGEARAGTLREHNCVVVTAKGQPFNTGIVLDCWRHSGRLFWAPLKHDHYPWIEDSAYAQIARGRAAPQRASSRARAKSHIEITSQSGVVSTQL